MTSDGSPAVDDLVVVYDGECPFCTAYVHLAGLRALGSRVRLVNARDPDPIVDEVRAQGFDLDEGMVLKLDGRYYHGADCLTRLAMLSSKSGAFNRLHRWIFRSPRLSRALYPLLRFGRNATLRLLGRRKISAVAATGRRRASIDRA